MMIDDNGYVALRRAYPQKSSPKTLSLPVDDVRAGAASTCRCAVPQRNHGLELRTRVRLLLGR